MFAVLAEELGFIGALVVFVLFAALLWRILVVRAGIRATRSARCSGPASRRCSCSSSFVNVGMVIGIMPITGIPLPFITQRRRVAREPGDRTRDRAEHQHPAAPRGVVMTIEQGRRPSAGAAESMDAG